jgi:hypothetical protein
MQAILRQIANHIMRPDKVMPASCVKAGCAQLQITIQILTNVLKRVEESRERWIVGKRMILVLRKVLIERLKLVVFHPYKYVPIVTCL